MFDFTTTTFIHDANMIEANPVNGTTDGSSKNVLRLENKIFKIEDVVAIYRNPYVEPFNAKLYVDVEGLMAIADKTNGVDYYKGAKRFKLDFYIRRSGDNNSFYSNDFVFKGKDFHYEWTNKQTTAKAVAKMINKIIRLYGDVYLKVYTEQVNIAAEGEEQNMRDMLVFENDNYGLFTEAQLKIYIPQESDCCTYREGGWEIVDELCGPVSYCTEGEGCDTVTYPVLNSENNEDYYAAATENTPQMGGWLKAEQGVNGFGTYEQILKDLRLPTMENFRWTSLNASEMPVPGNKYVQYTIHQISCRGVLGGSAVGEVTHSKTTHVFFVPTCGCGNEDLDSAMQSAIQAAGMDKLILSTNATTVGINTEPAVPTKNGDMDADVILADPTRNPIKIEKFEYDDSLKADTVNKPDAE